MIMTNREQESVQKKPENLDEKNLEETSKPSDKEINETPEEVSPTEEEMPQPENKEKEETVQIPKKRYDELVNAEAIALEEIKRARADSINFRRRVEKEKEEFQKFASANVFKKLIPLLDDIKRLIEHGKDEIPETHMASIESLEQRLQSIFQQEGVKIIEIIKKETKFDPRFHEAVFAQPTEEVEPNVVLDVISNGFYKENTVLRPAKVVISKAVEQPKEQDAAPSEENKEN